MLPTLTLMILLPNQLPDRTLEELETLALAGRRAITTCETQWTIETLVDAGVPSRMTNVARIWMDGSKLRIHNVRNEAGKQRIRFQCCPIDREGFLLHYAPVDQSDPMEGARVLPADEKSRAFLALVDPRVLGMGPYRALSWYDLHLAYFIGSPTRTNKSVIKDTYQGKPCYILSFIDPDKVDHPSVRVWIVPAMNYGIPRIAFTRKNAKEDFAADLETILKQDPNTKIWYPSRCELKATESGKIDSHEITTVDYVKMNVLLPEDAFKLSGQNLPEGTYISGRTNPKSPLAWKVVNGKVEPLGSPRTPVDLPTPVDEPDNASRWWLWASILAFVAIALTIFMIAKQKLGVNSNS
jgi:hypothetical protein